MKIDQKQETCSQREEPRSSGSNPGDTGGKPSAFKLKLAVKPPKRDSSGPFDEDTMWSALQSPQFQDRQMEEPSGKVQMLKVVAKLSIGPVTNCVLNLLVQSISTFFIGNTGDSALLASIGMGSMVINCIAFAVMQGLSSA